MGIGRAARGPRVVGAVALAAAVLTLAGCRSRLDRAVDLATARNAVLRRPATREQNFVRDRRTGEVLEEINGVFLGDGTFIRDGVQREWWPGGVLRSERWYVDDLPEGLWVDYWRNGSLRRVHRHDRDRATRYVSWHPNGVIAARGQAISGLRVGHWILRREHGALLAEGAYAGGARTGPWVLYDRDGVWAERGSYRGGARVGEWEWRTP